MTMSITSAGITSHSWTQLSISVTISVVWGPAPGARTWSTQDNRGSGIRAQGSGFRVQSSGFRALELGPRARGQGLGSRSGLWS